MGEERAVGAGAGLRGGGRGIVEGADAVEVLAGERGKGGVHFVESAPARGNGGTLARSPGQAQDLWVAIGSELSRADPSIFALFHVVVGSHVTAPCRTRSVGAGVVLRGPGGAGPTA